MIVGGPWQTPIGDMRLEDSERTWEDYVVLRALAEGTDRVAAYLVARYGEKGRQLAYKVCEQVGVLKAKHAVLYRLVQQRFGVEPFGLGIYFDFGRERVLDLMLERVLLFSTLEDYLASCWEDAKKLQFRQRVLPFTDPWEIQ